jgi:hypothetical protein
VFAYFDDLSFAASPFLPLIFRYDGTRYVEATREYPAYLQAQLDAALGALAGLPVQIPTTAGPDLAVIEHESTALRAYGLYALLGRTDEGLATLERRLAPPAAAWLESNAAAALDALSQRYAL